MPIAARGYALSGSNLVVFDPASPTFGSTIPITLVIPGEVLVGIDFRPVNGYLYGLGIDDANNRGTLYAISTRTGVATPVGPSGQVKFTTDGTTVVDLPAGGYGFDFNPASDRVRVTTDTSLNFRIDPNSGAPVDGDLSTSGINTDTPISGGTTGVTAAAHTNNDPLASITTLYTLDPTSDTLFIQNAPNSGNQTNPLPILLRGSPLDFTAVNGFDIPAGVNATSPNTGVTSGIGYATLTVGGTTQLYSINLATGAAAALGRVLDGATPTSGLAIHNDIGAPAFALVGSQLYRFNTADVGNFTTATVTGVSGTETLVAIDFQPSTGQLYGLAVNAAANTGTLYRINATSGAATVVGTPGSVALTLPAGGAVDLPAGDYAMDFNPNTGSIRVTTASGLNFRVGAISGNPIDSDFNLTNGFTADNPINGATSIVSASSHTNSFGGAGPTTLYTFDYTTDKIHIQNTPNSGTQSPGVQVTLDGAPLNLPDGSGFEIFSDVTVSASGAPVTFGYGVIASQIGIFRVNLVTGEATVLGVLLGFPAIRSFTMGDSPSNLFTELSETTTLPYFGSPFYARGGNDNVTGTTGVDIIYGDEGADILDGGAGADRLVGGAGQDSIRGGTGADVIDGGGEFDFAYYDQEATGVVARLDGGVNAGAATGDILNAIEGLIGSGHDDILIGDLQVNILNGNAGADALLGAGAGDTLNGDGGADLLMGGTGYDPTEAGTGADTLNGGAGVDIIYGQDGDDVIDGGLDADYVLAGAGNDTVQGGDGNDFLFAGSAYAFNAAGAGNDTLRGGEGVDFIVGGDGTDQIFGENGDDILYGGGNAGNETLRGGAGNDTILGEAGVDLIFGGAGFDYMYGGTGGDFFYFAVGDSYDWILDFSKAQGDTLNLDAQFGITSFAAFLAAAVDASSPGSPATVLTLNGGLDQITIFGIAKADWTAGMVSAF